MSVSIVRDVPEDSGELRMYGELAAWWPLLSSPADYAEEASFYRGVLDELSPALPGSLLELGSGGGNNASWMKSGLDDVTLVDLSAGMLEVSRRLNPECDHVRGDMRTVRLGKTFDCVFVHDAICYMTTPDDLSRVLETARVHCKPGGAALFAPDYTRETFASSTDHGGHDADGRGLRYLEWTWDPDPTDSTYLADYVFALRDRDGSVRTVHDRHLEGLFAEGDWLRLIESAGFAAHPIRWRHSEVDQELTVFAGIAR